MGGIRITDMFDRAMVDGMHARLAQVAESLGVDFAPREHAPSTKKALVISEHARGEGRLDAWREAAMNAHWRDGRDIEDEAVLRELAEAAGLDADAALGSLDGREVARILTEQRDEARRWGVTGIPTWFLLPTGWNPGQGRPPEGEPQPVRVVGCQPIEVVERAAQMAGAHAPVR